MDLTGLMVTERTGLRVRCREEPGQARRRLSVHPLGRRVGPGLPPLPCAWADAANGPENRGLAQNLRCALVFFFPAFTADREKTERL